MWILEIPNKDVVVESVHLSDSLMQLSYNIVEKLPKINRR